MKLCNKKLTFKLCYPFYPNVSLYMFNHGDLPLTTDSFKIQVHWDHAIFGSLDKVGQVRYLICYKDHNTEKNAC